MEAAGRLLYASVRPRAAAFDRSPGIRRIPGRALLERITMAWRTIGSGDGAPSSKVPCAPQAPCRSRLRPAIFSQAFGALVFPARVDVVVVVRRVDVVVVVRRAGVVRVGG